MKVSRLVLILLCLAGAYLLWRRTSEPAAEPEAKPTSELFQQRVFENLKPGSLGQTVSGQRQALDGAAVERKLFGDSLTKGRVVDVHGQGIDSAQLSWVAPTSQDLRWEAGWQADDWGRLERSEQHSKSDSSGFFEFDQSLITEGLIGSAIWATAEGYQANCFLLTALEHGTPWIVLQKSPSIQIRVEDAVGNPVPGALVEQFGLTPASAPTEVGGRLEPQRLRRLLYRTARTDSRGLAHLGAFPGEQVLRAKTEERSSEAWRGPAPEGLTLRLRDQFLVSGTLDLPDWSHLDYEGERRIQLGIRQGNLFKSLASLRAVKAGSWGPVLLPQLPGQLYFAKLEGSPIVPVTRYFDAPEPGGQASLNFRAELGSSVVLCGLDAQGQTVQDITATVWWDQDGARQSLTRRSPPGSPWANPWSMPPGDLYFSVSAPGYAPGTGGPIRLPEARQVAHPVQLLPAGRLRGRVTFGGAPVEDFELFVWLKNSHASDQRIAFRGRQDGRFAIDTAPLGEVAVSVSSGFHPPSAYQLITIPKQGTAELAIELEAASVGLGRVIALESGEPIGAAQLVVTQTHGGLDYGPLGLPQSTRSDGSFRLEGMLPGPNLVRVSAPGYAPAFLTTAGVPGKEVDCGTVVLSRPRSLELRLLSPDPGIDFSRYSAVIPFPKVLPLTPFGADGVLRCEVASGGNFTIQMMRAERQVATLWAAFYPGEPWVIEYRLGAGRRVEGQVVGSDSVPLEQAESVDLLYADQRGSKITRYTELDEEGRFGFDDVPSNSVSVSVRNGARVIIARESGTFGAERVLRLNPVLGAEAVRFRVLDKSGAPLALALLDMRELEGRPFFHQDTTNAQGELLALGLPEDPIEVFVQHREHGFGMLRHSSGAREVELRLRADSSMQVRVFDGDLPLAGARVAVSDARGARMFAFQSSQADGRVSLERYSAGNYRLLASHPHCWPLLFEAAASPGGVATEVQLRRLGNLELRASDESGAPLAGVEFKLQGDWESGDVAQWIANGRVEASGQRTDARGLLRLEGLPHGEYRWSSGTSHGVITVLPLETRQVPLVLGR